ncbi:Gldg family protein [Ochrovirga pacifica]|uniref:Gldg family protein n=1 Tax=Ochrovirga pacifica TaxID=1042376 RepID=UPI0002559FD0|nr:Gldg family protein [Ochrovirga pacifica]
MRKIQKIAQLELSLMFFSPSAWIVLVVFFVQTGVTFTDLLYKYETNQQLGRPLQVLTKILFAGEDGILTVAQQYLALYIPLITMGLMTRETHSGSIKLLYSSPVKTSEIIFGKFLAVAVYNLLLALVLVSFIPVAYATIEHVDVWFVLGGVLGVYLLMCAYAAIGLYLSCLTQYAVVAVVSTFAVLAFLNFIGEVGQAYDFVREITYWLSLRNRTDAFVNGLLVSQNVLYFLLVIFLFLTLSIWWLKNQRRSSSLTQKTMRYGLLIVGVLTVGYVSNLPQWNVYVDTTRFKDRTLTPNSQKLIGQFTEPIRITTYVNVIHYSAQYGAPENRIKDLKRFDSYRRFMPNLKMDYVYYYDSIPYMSPKNTIKQMLQKAAKVHKIALEDIKSPEEIRAFVNLKAENNRLVRFIHYKDKTLPLRMFDDIYVYPKEKDISSVLKTLLEQPGKVGVLAANGERSIKQKGDESYQFLLKGLNIRGSLINSGFEVFPINLDRINEIEPLDVLLISDPVKAYNSSQLQKINDYIQKGGNVMFAAEASSSKYLNTILNPLGVQFMQGSLLQESEDFSPDLIQVSFVDSLKTTPFQFYDQAKMVHPKAIGIALSESSEFTYTPITLTNKQTTWVTKQPVDLATQTVVFDSVHQQKIAAPIAVALTRERNKKIQKIVLVGDADFMSNEQVARNSPRHVNILFAQKMFKWFANNRYPVATGRPKSIDNVILVDRDQINGLKIILLGVVPLIIISLQASLLIRRFRK